MLFTLNLYPDESNTLIQQLQPGEGTIGSI